MLHPTDIVALFLSTVKENSMGKFLEFIGLRIMTNREALMEELDQVTDEAFPRYLSEAIDIVSAKPTEWLSEPCEVDRLLNPREEEHHG